jgi:hypothetical protein
MDALSGRIVPTTGGEGDDPSSAVVLAVLAGNADALALAYRNCRDVVRIDKGHTEGLEPKITEELVKLMLSARGGKFQQGG